MAPPPKQQKAVSAFFKPLPPVPADSSRATAPARSAHSPDDLPPPTSSKSSKSAPHGVQGKSMHDDTSSSRDQAARSSSSEARSPQPASTVDAGGPSHDGVASAIEDDVDMEDATHKAKKELKPKKNGGGKKSKEQDKAKGKGKSEEKGKGKKGKGKAKGKGDESGSDSAAPAKGKKRNEDGLDSPLIPQERDLLKHAHIATTSLYPSVDILFKSRPSDMSDKDLKDMIEKGKAALAQGKSDLAETLTYLRALKVDCERKMARIAAASAKKASTLSANTVATCSSGLELSAAAAAAAVPAIEASSSSSSSATLQVGDAEMAIAPERPSPLVSTTPLARRTAEAETPAAIVVAGSSSSWSWDTEPLQPGDIEMDVPHELLDALAAMSSPKPVARRALEVDTSMQAIGASSSSPVSAALASSDSLFSPGAGYSSSSSMPSSDVDIFKSSEEPVPIDESADPFEELFESPLAAGKGKRALISGKMGPELINKAPMTPTTGVNVDKKRSRPYESPAASTSSQKKIKTSRSSSPSTPEPDEGVLQSALYCLPKRKSAFADKYEDFLQDDAVRDPKDFKAGGKFRAGAEDKYELNKRGVWTLKPYYRELYLARCKAERRAARKAERKAARAASRKSSRKPSRQRSSSMASSSIETLTIDD